MEKVQALNKKNHVLFITVLGFSEFLITAIITAIISRGTDKPVIWDLSIRKVCLIFAILTCSLFVLINGLNVSRNQPSLEKAIFQLPPRLIALLILVSIIGIIPLFLLFLVPSDYYTSFQNYLAVLKPLIYCLGTFFIQLWFFVGLERIVPAICQLCPKIIPLFRASFRRATNPLFYKELIGRIQKMPPLWIILLICSIALLVATIYRASTFTFTHDESLSYAGFTWQPEWKYDANNHLLNSVLMKLCTHLFGNSELSLRFPNILAHILYLGCTLAILKRVKETTLIILGFVFLNLNPFILDYFFVARGYGLALAFQMLGIYFMIQSYENKKNQRFVLFLYLSTFSGALSVLSNFTFLNFYLPLLLVSAWFLFSDATLVRFTLNKFKQAVVLFSINGLVVVFALVKLLNLKKLGRLYFGGKTGLLIDDTIGSLIHVSIYSSSSIEKALSIFIAVLFILLLLQAFLSFIIQKKTSLFTLFSLLLSSATALSIIQHYVINTPWPFERSAIYFLPIFALTIIGSLQNLLHSRITQPKILTGIISALIAIPICCNLFINFNSHPIHEWGYDLHDDEVLTIIDQDRKCFFPSKVINIGNSWQMEPVLNYYRVTHNNSWLSVVTRQPINLVENDYIYAFISDVQDLEKNSFTIIKNFQDTNTVLLRVNKAKLSSFQ